MARTQKKLPTTGERVLERSKTGFGGSASMLTRRHSLCWQRVRNALKQYGSDRSSPVTFLQSRQRVEAAMAGCRGGVFEELVHADSAPRAITTSRRNAAAR